MAGLTRWWSLCIMFWLYAVLIDCTLAQEFNRAYNVYTAVVNITYRDPATGQMKSEKEEMGHFGSHSLVDLEWGWVVHVRTSENHTHGCDVPHNVPRGNRWIALIQRGTCTFQEKIVNAAIRSNASAVVIYNNLEKEDPLLMNDRVEEVVSIFITKSDGERIARLVDNGTSVMMYIMVGELSPNHIQNNINRTSVLFVSISFIVLMIISLAWLVFYYIQRFRYAHAKERLSKRLMNAAKKAITKMPVRTVKSGDKETESDFDQCAVCIEGYKTSDIIRILPCKHLFHKYCVDPWLIEQRSCPMCKMDILKAYGLQIQGSRESVNIEGEGASASMSPSEQVAATTSQLEDTDDVQGVEIVRYQPPQIEYHDKGRSGSEEDDLVGEVAATEALVSSHILAPAESLDSVRSTDSDSNEWHALMPVPSATVTRGNSQHSLKEACQT